MDNNLTYWLDAVNGSLEEAGVAATPAQAFIMAENLQVCSANEGLWTGSDVADSNCRAARQEELADLKRQLREEQDKVTCRACGGSGTIREQGPCHSSETSCTRCRGTGRHSQAIAAHYAGR